MPGRIDQNRPFLPVNIAILTVSDTRDASQDRLGDTLADLVTSAGHRVATRKIVCDEQDEIIAQLREWIADPDIDVVISTGVTGVTGRDVTPEAFHIVYEKEIAGFGELFRRLQLRQGWDLDDPEPRDGGGRWRRPGNRTPTAAEIASCLSCFA